MQRFHFDTFCRTVQDQRITYAYVVPPVILELVSNPRVSEYDLRSLRMMLSAAAPLATELIHALREKLDLSVRQAYGMSECSPCTHMQVCIPSLISISASFLTHSRHGPKRAPTPAPSAVSSPT